MSENNRVRQWRNNWRAMLGRFRGRELQTQELPRHPRTLAGQIDTLNFANGSSAVFEDEAIDLGSVEPGTIMTNSEIQRRIQERSGYRSEADTVMWIWRQARLPPCLKMSEIPCYECKKKSIGPRLNSSKISLYLVKVRS